MIALQSPTTKDEPAERLQKKPGTIAVNRAPDCGFGRADAKTWVAKYVTFCVRVAAPDALRSLTRTRRAKCLTFCVRVAAPDALRSLTHAGGPDALRSLTHAGGPGCTPVADVNT